jgi:ATP-dependent Lon protease
VPEEQNIETLPLLPIRNTVLPPHIRMPLPVGRPPSVAAVEAAASSEDKEIAVFTQRDSETPPPGH